jgi:hypothetical protein
MRFQRLCSHRYCARGADDGNAKRSSKQRERSHEQEYLSVIGNLSKRETYIGEQA